MSDDVTEHRSRLYRQVARAHGVQDTERRIIEAATQLFAERHYDDVLLADVATLAGVSTKTVLRHFGDKEGLARAFMEAAGRQNGEMRDAVQAGDVAGAVAFIAGMYELVGDTVVRTLRVEDRVPMVKAFADKGRELHRAWIERVFGPLLLADRESALVLLLVATDVWVWHLLRRDQALSAESTHAAMKRLVEAALSPTGA